MRGARIVLVDDDGVRAAMTGSWLAQMGWDTWAISPAAPDDLTREGEEPDPLPEPDPADRYRRPYEGTGNARTAMEAYLTWESGLVEQLKRDGTHHSRVVRIADRPSPD